MGPVLAVIGDGVVDSVIGDTVAEAWILLQDNAIEYIPNVMVVFAGVFGLGLSLSVLIGVANRIKMRFTRVAKAGL